MIATHPSHLSRWRNEIIFSRRLLTFALFCFFFGGGHAVAATDAFFAKWLWTGDGPPLQDAVLLVRDGKIIAVGGKDEVKTPADAHRHDLDQAVVIPGLVVAETQLASGSKNGQRSLAPQLLALDGFDFFDDYSGPLSGGVTTVQISAGGSRLMPGQGAVVKLAGESIEDRVLSGQESLQIILSQAARNPPTVYSPPVGAVSVDNPLETTRPQLAKSLAGAVAGVRVIFRAARRQAALDDIDLEPDASLHSVVEYYSGKRTFRITAATAAEVRAAVELAMEFKLQVLLVDIGTTEPIERQLKRIGKRLRGVVLNAGVQPGKVINLPRPSPDQPAEKMPWDHARRLLDCGVKVAIHTSSDADLAELLFVSGLFQQGGLSRGEILRSLTLMPAEMLGVADRVGSLRAGKDADFVILSGRPFAVRTQVLATYVGGRRVFDGRKQTNAIVVQAAQIYDGSGGLISSGAIVVEGGKIRGLGADVSAPLHARIRNFGNAVIVPGFVDLATGLGVGGPLSSSVPVQTKLGEQLDPNDTAIEVARQGGVTTVVLGSTGSSPSPMIAFKLGPKARVLQDPVALRFSVKGNLSSTIPALKRTLTQAKVYASAWTKYDAELVTYNTKLKAYEVEKAKFDAAAKAAEAKAKADEAKKAEEAKKKEAAEKKTEQTPGDKKPEEEKDVAAGKTPPKTATVKPPEKPNAPKKPSTSSSLDPYRPLFAKKIPAFVEARNVNELRAAVKLFRDEFQLTTVIIGADDAMRDLDLLSEKDVRVSIGPTLVRTVDRQTVNIAQVLANRQIRFGFQSQATTGVKTLPLAVQFAVRKGLGAGDALSGLTRWPAEILSLDSQIGTLAVGKDADLVVLSGPPFELSTKVIAVMIDGEWVYEEESKP
jgi:imidazolonepropionase-like amidohydrolase